MMWQWRRQRQLLCVRCVAVQLYAAIERAKNIRIQLKKVYVACAHSRTKAAPKLNALSESSDRDRAR